jgi:hypothetical protein
MEKVQKPSNADCLALLMKWKGHGRNELYSIQSAIQTDAWSEQEKE